MCTVFVPSLTLPARNGYRRRNVRTEMAWGRGSIPRITPAPLRLLRNPDGRSGFRNRLRTILSISTKYLTAIPVNTPILITDTGDFSWGPEIREIVMRVRHFDCDRLLMRTHKHLRSKPYNFPPAKGESRAAGRGFLRARAKLGMRSDHTGLRPPLLHKAGSIAHSQVARKALA